MGQYLRKRSIHYFQNCNFIDVREFSNRFQQKVEIGYFETKCLYKKYISKRTAIFGNLEEDLSKI
jgi:hypothetical protein